MPKTAYEKALEKQQRENQKIAAQEARRQYASTIVSGQPVVSGMRIMDAASEEVFAALLKLYDGNENRYIQGDNSVFPVPYRNSILSEFEKLRMYGMVSSVNLWLSGWEATLTPQGLSYFDDKEKALATAASAESTPIKPSRKKYDVFISHANKDKLSYVNDLYSVLSDLGIEIFYDSKVLSWGDKWKDVILNGTEQSEFAIIVISENFFGREWTEKELNTFLEQENTSGQKIVLPLLYNVTIDQLKAKYPALEEIQAISTSDYTKEQIAILFAQELIKRYK